jgi:hypothetical protein
MSGPPCPRTIFQFDQCLNDRSIADACNAQGLAVVYRFPRRLTGKEDPEVLDDLLAKPNPLITVDLGMVRDHLAHVPEFHPGIVSISNARVDRRTLTSKLICRILDNFKARFPQWHQVGFRNTIAEITPVGVELAHIESGTFIRDGYLTFDQEGWVAELESILLQNAGRSMRLEGETPGG